MYYETPVPFVITTTSLQGSTGYDGVFSYLGARPRARRTACEHDVTRSVLHGAERHASKLHTQPRKKDVAGKRSDSSSTTGGSSSTTAVSSFELTRMRGLSRRAEAGKTRIRSCQSTSNASCASCRARRTVCEHDVTRSLLHGAERHASKLHTQPRKEDVAGKRSNSSSSR